jgi:transcriptional regulator with XRE-family HTH domain
MARAKAFTAKTFGHNLRRLRKARGFTQEGFALMSGIDRAYVGGVERGDRNPALAMILRLAEALELPPKALFEDGADASAASGSGRQQEQEAPAVSIRDRSR